MLRAGFAEKDLRILVVKLNLNQQCELAVMATNILGCSRKITARPYSLLSSGECLLPSTGRQPALADPSWAVG